MTEIKPISKAGIGECPVCHTKFARKNDRHIYCSYECNYKAYREFRRKVDENDPLPKPEKDPNKKKVYREKVCPFCKTVFRPNSGRQKFCSEKCRENYNGKPFPKYKWEHNDAW